MKSKTFLPLVLAWFAASIAGQLRAEPAANAQINRGQYLVERVALCADCHTARNWRGKQDRERWLEGARLDFKPAKIMPWAAVAPAIAGLPTFAADEPAVKYFQTGLNRDDKRSSPPMPQYRLDPDDAMAVVAYLRTLKPPSKPSGK
jgi:mono/diheme cytochrome c family protein